jgi:prevent-host-death family protein
VPTKARTNFHRFLSEVATGASITITRRGIPVARLVPVDDSTASADAMLDRIRTLRKGNSLDGLSIRELIDEGRRY